MLALVSSGLQGQISPGDLTDAHAHLEGMSNCTVCHTLGAKVSNDKCLECHKHLNQRIIRGKGYHASAEVQGKDCFKCHSEHHGRKFEMIRFDTSAFDHNLTGYRLEGQHGKINCASCHKADNIIDFNIREKKKTYLGLTTECLLCHADHHANTLSAKCTECHNFEAFKPAVNFDHDRTEYPLRGQHVKVDCRSCHQPDAEDRLRIFSEMKFSDCDACHDDAHSGRFFSNCSACHKETSFSDFAGGRGFDHSRTDFPLQGAHARQDCRDCHDLTRRLPDVFMDHSGVDGSSCVVCHEDVHEGRFGRDCSQCHNQSSFLMEEAPESFNHDLTDFHLQGKHLEVDCRSCHTTNLTDPVAFANCTDCHQDFHEGQFVMENKIRDCDGCHNVFGFEESTFDFDDHALTAFPLQGAHMATPCFVCHLSEEKTWIFRNLGQACNDCHDNVHQGFMDERFFEGESCTGCHSEESWSQITFDHDATNFELRGKHSEASCAACHEESERFEFSDLSTECAACHEEPHREQFAENGRTDCRRCHDENYWSPSQFDHDSAAFVLDGAHLSVRCDECHFTVSDEKGIFINYEIEKFECIDCHQ